MKLLERSQIDDKYKWDLTSYFKDEQDFEKSYQKVCKLGKDIGGFAGKLNNADNIFQCLNLQNEIEEICGALYVYSVLKKDEDVTIGKSQERLSKIENKDVELSQKTAYIIPELCKLDDTYLNKLILDKNFAAHRRFIELILRMKKHTLSEAEENILAGIGSFSHTFREIMDNFDDGDLKFNNINDSNGKSLELNHTSIQKYLRNDDRILRKNAYIEYKQAYARNNNFLASNYLGYVKKNVFFAKTRKFNSVLESSLYYEEIDQNIYKNLLACVNKNIALNHRYLEAKRNMLGLNKLAAYDLSYNPLKTAGGNFAYEKARKLVELCLSPLGKDYCDVLQKLFDARCIDVMPSKNKRSGGYSFGAYGKMPVVFLNHKNDYNSVATLAHELGHAAHRYYCYHNQPIAAAHSELFLAEIASNVNECLLNRYMLQNSKTKEEKLFYITEFLLDFHSSVFGQGMLAEFEANIYEKCEQNSPLSKDVLNDTYFQLVKKYNGDKVEILDVVKHDWSRIPHFFNVFYVYHYVSGLMTAITIADNILKNKPGAVEGYIGLLKSGSSKGPIELLKDSGIDINDSSVFDTAFEYFKDYLQQFEKLIN